MLLQMIVILLVSIAASYAFQHTQTVYTITGLCFYRYFIYGLAAPLSYVCFSRFRRTVALGFSLFLLIVAISPYGQEAIELFPSFVPILATLMGVVTILYAPKSKGRGFFEFVGALILPAVLVESRIGSSAVLIATTESISYYGLIAVIACVLGGYFYLRFATLTNLGVQQLSSSGSDGKDLARLSLWNNLFMILVIAGALGTATILMMTVPVVADVFRPALVTLPTLILALALGAGITIAIVIYSLKQSERDAIS